MTEVSRITTSGIYYVGTYTRLESTIAGDPTPSEASTAETFTVARKPWISANTLTKQIYSMSDPTSTTITNSRFSPP